MAKKKTVKKSNAKVAQKPASKLAKKPAKKLASKPAKKVTAKPAPKMATTTAKMLKLQPLQNRIVIEIETQEKMTPGGLYIPDTAQMTGNFKGRVIAVGSGHVSKKGKLRPLELKVGDQVLFSEWAGDKLELNGKSVRILRESDVLGLVD